MAPDAAAKKGDPAQKKVLVVDDDEHICAIFRTALESEGFTVQTGRDGRNILKKAIDFKPDLILTDLMMPGGGGYEVLRSLQSEETTRKTPVIMITGAAMDMSTQAMIKQEPNLAGYLEKPISPERLVKQVHLALNTMSMSEKAAQERNQAVPKKIITSFDDVL